jgi:hypothetical protein
MTVSAIVGCLEGDGTPKPIRQTTTAAVSHTNANIPTARPVIAHACFVMISPPRGNSTKLVGALFRPYCVDLRRREQRPGIRPNGAGFLDVTIPGWPALLHVNSIHRARDGSITEIDEVARSRLNYSIYMVPPIARIFSCTLIGPWSHPDASSAARTRTAWTLTSSVSFDGLDRGPPGLGLEHRRWPLDQSTLAQFVEGLAGDAVLVAEGRHRPAWGVFRPLRDREADTGINGFMGSHRRSLVVEVSPPRRSRLSPMS